MPTISRTITINAPIEKVFDFVVSPDNWTKYVTSLVEVRDLSSPAVDKGTTFVWKYRMLGLDFGGKGTIIENVKNAKFGMKMEGGFPITENYGFRQNGGGTDLTVEVIYETPSKIMSVVSKSSLVEKLNQKEAEAVLDKIKMMCED
ncbi:MAG: SRPBCC family protein [Nitrospirota bacterium]|nr:SRPBCC family protein [Nitrospirota bacterium]